MHVHVRRSPVVHELDNEGPVRLEVRRGRFDLVEFVPTQMDG